MVRNGQRSGPRLEAMARRAAREAAADEAGTRELFRGLIEPLSDSFEPAAVGVYKEIFTAMIAELMPGFDSRALAARFESIRAIRPFDGDPASVKRIYVLSRVTLGADVAVTSVLMDAVKKAFPVAQILFAGNRKNAEVWAGDARVEHLPTPYGRTATLMGRLEAAGLLRTQIGDPAGIVIDPDSRFTQLGLIPVCDDGRYYFFDSRAIGGAGGENLAELARGWARATFGVADARGYIAPGPVQCAPGVSVSFGVGENPAKRVGARFEAGVLAHLSSRGLDVVVDEGAGGEESERVRQAVAAARNTAGVGRIEPIAGPFAPFAATVAASRLYVGYDSAGQHVAAVCGVPFVVAFAGAPNERFFQRWRPDARGPCEVIRADGMSEGEVLRKACDAIDRLAI
jgi:hypothetical protein